MNASESKSVSESAKDSARLYQAAPDWNTLKREVPGVTVSEQPDGSRAASFDVSHLPEFERQRAKERLTAVFHERRTIEIEQQQRRNESTEAVTLRDRDGNTKSVPARIAERTAHKSGMHERPYWGKGKRVAWIDAAGKYHRAED